MHFLAELFNDAEILSVRQHVLSHETAARNFMQFGIESMHSMCL
jgi:hypothetical protein